MWTAPTFWAAFPSILFGLACVLASVGWIIVAVRADFDGSGDTADERDTEDDVVFEDWTHDGTT